MGPESHVPQHVQARPAPALHHLEDRAVNLLPDDVVPAGGQNIFPGGGQFKGGVNDQRHSAVDGRGQPHINRHLLVLDAGRNIADNLLLTVRPAAVGIPLLQRRIGDNKGMHHPLEQVLLPVNRDASFAALVGYDNGVVINVQVFQVAEAQAQIQNPFDRKTL